MKNKPQKRGRSNMTNLEAIQIAKMFMTKTGQLVCWTEIKKASKKENHGLLSKNGETYDVFGTNVKDMIFK
jgi:hypothetical protein